MKFSAATTLLLTTLALASPAPVAKPDAVAEPISIESRTQLGKTLAARNAIAMPDIQLAERATTGGKGGKGGSGGSGNSTESAASDMLSPSRVLQATALGLGVVEVVRLWV
jgi:hypothetical protein